MWLVIAFSCYCPWLWCWIRIDAGRSARLFVGLQMNSDHISTGTRVFICGACGTNESSLLTQLQDSLPPCSLEEVINQKLSKAKKKKKLVITKVIWFWTSTIRGCFVCTLFLQSRSYMFKVLPLNHNANRYANCINKYNNEQYKFITLIQRFITIPYKNYNTTCHMSDISPLR